VKRSSKAEQIELLGNVSLFSECSKKELGQVASMMEERRVESGTELTREGEEGDEFFVVAEGLADASIAGRKVGSIRRCSTRVRGSRRSRPSCPRACSCSTPRDSLASCATRRRSP
jgi:hypothetical protein